MDDLNRRFQDAAKKLRTQENARHIEEAYLLLEEFQSRQAQQQLSREEIKLFAACYNLLGWYQEAYDLLDRMENKNQKEMKTMLAYQSSAGNWGGKAILKRRKILKTAQKTALPVFKYCPDPLGSGIFSEDGIVECDCCGYETPVYYSNSLYAEEEIDFLCPQCIHNGKAAKKFKGEFQQDLFNDEGVINPAFSDEIMHRTPGYESWQGNNWPGHCDDYCAFIAYVGADDITNMQLWDTLDNVSDMELEHLRAHMSRKGHLSGYLFQCLKCNVYVLYADCD